MKKILILIFLFTITLTGFGQTLSEKEIHGKWIVEKVIKKPSNLHLWKIIKGFENSTYFFNENGDFQLITTSKSESFEMLTKMINGNKWEVEKNKQYVKIVEKEDGQLLLGIFIRENKGKKIFEIDETGIILQMNKIE